MKNQNLSLFFIPWFDIETKAFIKTKSAIFFVDLYNSTKTGVFFYVFELVSGVENSILKRIFKAYVKTTIVNYSYESL